VVSIETSGQKLLMHGKGIAAKRCHKSNGSIRLMIASRVSIPVAGEQPNTRQGHHMHPDSHLVVGPKVGQVAVEPSLTVLPKTTLCNSGLKHNDDPWVVDLVSRPLW
jgi:hypothetical protein